MFLLVTRPPGGIQDGEISKRVVCLCLTKSHIKVEIRNTNVIITIMKCDLQKENEWSLEAYRFKSLVSIKVFFLKYYNRNGNTR